MLLDIIIAIFALIFKTTFILFGIPILIIAAIILFINFVASLI